MQNECQMNNKKSVGVLRPIVYHQSYGARLQVGMDLIGPMPEPPRGNKCIITLTDYLAKAAPRTDKTPMGVAKFVTFQHARGNIPAGERCVCILFMLAA